ncbi:MULTISPECIES: excinuclease ABC subunit C [Neptunomonas]|uniref:Excinuclease ABC subunit C n=1 Tax=Neptunomonas marina TaxID=1815562 RepID=A0A437Q4K7_9GAMM|nr:MULTISPECIES: excinuclease ABC subunit C [Neptunomonas]RVU29412.1 excinuclease ABC subunit C [Neptunomonas marina]
MSRETLSAIRREDLAPLASDTNINTILMNGAQIALSKLKRAPHFNARLYYYAEIGVFLEVSLSRGAGISDGTREALKEIHTEATHIHMQANKARREAK